MEATNAHLKPYLSIRPESGWAALGLAEVWQFRELLVSFAVRDIKLRYRQTALGVAWVALQPLLGAGLLSFAFNKIGKIPTGSVPPFLFSFAGMLAWNAFSNTLGKSGTCLVGNAHLVSKIYFPRLTIPLSTVLSTLLDFGVSLLLLAVLLIAYHVNPGPRILLLPVWLALLLALATGIGLFTSALTVSYRDVQYIVPVAVQFLLFASPIAYPLAALSGFSPRTQQVYRLNPLAGLMEAVHWSTVGQGALEPRLLCYCAAVSLAVLFAGAYAFKRMERRFADVI